VDRSANMRAIRSKDMRPELAVRSLVHGMGYRFRFHRKNLPGNPDLVFFSRRIASPYSFYEHAMRRKICSLHSQNSPRPGKQYLRVTPSKRVVGTNPALNFASHSTATSR